MDWWMAFTFWYAKITYFKLPHQIEYIKQLSSYLEQDINILEAIESTRDAYAHIYNKNHIAVKISNLLPRSYSQPKGMKPVIKLHFHPDIAIIFELLRIDTSNANNIGEVIRIIDTESKLKRDSITSLLMPTMVFIVGLVILIVIGGVLLPMIEERAKKPVESTEAEFARMLWTFFSGYWFLYVPGLLAGLGALRYMQRNLVNSFRVKLDGIWPLCMYKQFCSVRFLTLTSLLKSSNVPDDEAFNLIAEYSDNYLKLFMKRYANAYLIGDRRESYFGKGLLDTTQLIRLRRFFSGFKDEKFNQALLSTSKQSAVDFEVSARSILSRWQLFISLSGIILGALGIGIVLDGGILIAD